MKIKVKYHAQIDKLERIAVGDWIDLRTAEGVCIRQGEFQNISLGVSMELPDGYEAHILPRSSTFARFGIICANGMGIIDSSYKGDGDVWHFPAVCLAGKIHMGGENMTLIPKNTRICQFRIMPKMPDVEFVEVESLGNDDRGGLGSTGL